MVGEQVDHYEVLCISSAASSDEIKRAYRSLSRLFHPDKAGLHLDEESKREHERRMISLNAAYQILMSPRQRRTYDLSRDLPTVQPQQQKSTSTYTAAATAAARRAASWGGHSRSFTPRHAHVHPMPGSSGLGTAGRNSPDEAFGTKPNGTASFSQGSVPRPRYYTAGKYTHSARQARRMDPSQYTTHVDGRAHEFDAPVGTTGACGKVPTTSVGSENNKLNGSDNDSVTLGAPRNPTWLQKKMDLAAEWEDKFCPAEPVEKYQWRKASDNWLRNIRERKSAREQLEEESEKLNPCIVPGQMNGYVT